MTSCHPATPSLRQVQAALAARILDSASPSDTALLGWIAVPAPVPAGARVAVYANGYPARVHDALADTYSALARLVGDAAFAALAQRYAAAVPLTSYNLNDAGAQLGAFLGGDELGRERPYLPDLAALEWRVAQAFHAAERPALDPTTLPWTVDDWDRAILEFQPSVAIVGSKWQIVALWSEAEIPEADSARAAGGGQEILVRRVGLGVRCESIDADEAAALRLLLDGHSLGACMDHLETAGQDPAAVAAWCARWMQSGMIAGARLDNAC